jgi:hypothetical protein
MVYYEEAPTQTRRENLEDEKRALERRLKEIEASLQQEQIATR